MGIRSKLQKVGALKTKVLVFPPPTTNEKGESVPHMDAENFTIRMMSGHQRDWYEGQQKKRIQYKGQYPDLNTLNTKDARAELIALCLVDDESGELAFDVNKKDDKIFLGRLSGNLADFLYEECMRFNQLDKAAREDAEKKSGTPTPNAGNESPSD